MEYNDKELLITFNDTTRMILVCGYADSLNNKKCQKDYEVIDIEYFADFGDISNLPFSQERFYRENYFTEVDSVYEKIQGRLKQLQSLDKGTRIELFVNPNWTNEPCNLYFFAKEFKGFTNVYLNYYHTKSEQGRFGCYYSKLVIDKRIHVTDKEIEDFVRKWDELCKNNAPLRVYKDGEIKEYSYQEAKDMVLSVMTTSYKRYPYIFQDILKKYSGDGDNVIPYNGIEYIVQKLIDEKIVERTHNSDVQSGCPDIFFEQEFRLIQ